MRAAGTDRNTVRARSIALFLLLCVVLASCGYEEGHESLEVRYEGVPINLEAAEETRAESDRPSSGTSPSEGLAYTAESIDNPASEPVDEPANEPATRVDAKADETPDEMADEQDHLAHRAPDPPAEQPDAEDPTSTVEDLESEDSDHRARRRALNSFRGLVRNATNLSSNEVDCIVEYVRTSGVNPVPMNRVLRRGLSGKTNQPPQRYVALAYDATNACGVTLSESLLR